MKTIVVFSDSHHIPLPKQLENVAHESDYVFFLGDGLSGLGDILFNDGFHAVRGNCDGYNGFPDEDVVQVENVKFLLTHGHNYHFVAGGIGNRKRSGQTRRTRPRACLV